MRVLVTYHSDTGNTKKVAEAIADSLQKKTGVDLVPLSAKPPAANYDLYFVGFPVNAHSIPHAAESYMKSLPEGASVALFATHGSLRGGPLAKTAFEQGGAILKKAKLVGTFGCRGKVRQEIIDALMQKPEHRPWAVEAQGASSHPDESDLADAAAFALKIFNKANA
ncbi:MAG: flavodoxin family protein [Thermodesulfobacteriota bacterium]